MRTLSSAFALFAAAALLLSATIASAKPNIIFILTDDLGYGDVGVLYQNSRPAGKPRMSTPQLDAMAAQGMILRQYSSSPVCAPARASLLLGQHQGDCAIRNNQFDKALPHNHTLGTVLKEAGYYTGMIGKYAWREKPRIIRRIPDAGASMNFMACSVMAMRTSITPAIAAKSWTVLPR